MNSRVYFVALSALVFAVLAGFAGFANAKTNKRTTNRQDTVVAKEVDGVAEARLIEIYRLIGKGQNRDALAKAGVLVQGHPNFQLAHLVYGDLLAARVRLVKTLGDIPEQLSPAASNNLSDLREESARRIKALRERPPAGTIPSQFLAVSQRSKHAIAVDASKSRLYLFENTPTGMNLMADFYISVGKAGTAKVAEGDQRTPLGVYYVTSNLDPKSLKDFYGSGALPINYPNVLDMRRGKTGSGIWLHGTPPTQYARAPQASDGCVVLANPDLEVLLRTIEVRTTPVVIAPQLQWVTPHTIRTEGKSFEEALHAWRNAKTAGDINHILSFYTQDFTSNGKNLAQWTPALKAELSAVQGRTIQLKDISFIRWTDAADTMVVTFGELAEGIRNGTTKRQYWIRQSNQWKIFFEGVV